MAPIREPECVASNIPVASPTDQRILRAKAAAQEARRKSERTSSISGPDQYVDGVAASVWEEYIGDKREERYCEWLIGTLKNHNVVKVLDVACGTGVDSRMLVKEGFHVTSCDLSDNMLQKARNTKADKGYKNWEIFQADWCKLPEQLKGVDRNFDAVICMGNSFAHLPDECDGKKNMHQLAISNFREMLKPGGILIIDHRNFDYIVKNGKSPSKNIYYMSTFSTTVDTTIDKNAVGEATNITLDYKMTVPRHVQSKLGLDLDGSHDQVKFQLTYFPHYLSSFRRLLRKVFRYSIDDVDATSNTSYHFTCADFQPLEEIEESPAYFIHVIVKQINVSPFTLKAEQKN